MVVKRSGTGNQNVLMKSVESDDSDEDYVAEVETSDDQSDELDFLVGDASEEISCFEAEEEGEVGWRRVAETRARKRSARHRYNDMKRPNKRRVTSNDDEDYDDDGDEDEEGFTLEEEDEEEYRVLEGKSRKRKRKRTTLKKSTSVKRQGKTSVKAKRKPCAKIRKNLRSLSRRTKSHGGEKFVKRGPTVRDEKKRKRVCRRKLVTDGSKSGLCSDSSEYEFTISEEEGEQIREANITCGSVTTNLRSSTRIQEDETIFETKTPPTTKGKAKEEVKKKDVSKLVCGICWTKEGKNTIRGMLNCCSHYFCFKCIYEWSKVETRCPLCKQRFVSISKPARCGKGFGITDTIVSVPERDQVYQPSEEELRDFLNPYENVICIECHHGGDDALMLLCDICDSPAHTYCVGLGQEVPEDNWYCDGCRSAALGSSHSQTQEFTPAHRSSTVVSDGTSTYENKAEIDLNVAISETPVSEGNGYLSSPRFLGGSSQTPLPISGVGVSTVSGRRLIHRQIQHILSNRLSQISPGADISALGNLISWGIDLTQQQIRTTDIRSSHHAQYVDGLQENPYISAQYWNSFTGRMGYMIRHIGQSSTSQNGLVHSQIHWSGLNNVYMGVGQSQILAGEQVHPYTSRSSIGTSLSHPRYEEHANIVKQQVSLMVRSHLNSLSRDMNLGHNNYIQVEISRRSAHSIMAAYGLEPRRRDTYEAYPPICLHFESRLVNAEASPINDYCLACFEAFVKDVVKQIMDTIVQPHWFGFRT